MYLRDGVMQCTLEMVVVAIVLVETLMAEVAIVLVSIGGECSAVYLRGGGFLLP